MPRDYIGEFEQLVLMTILRLGDEAYGATVRDEIADRTGRDVRERGVTTLERLEHKKTAAVADRRADAAARRPAKALLRSERGR